jgi:hypothetical protein
MLLAALHFPSTTNARVILLSLVLLWIIYLS